VNVKGGIYFTKLNNVTLWINYIREVEIVDDSWIYVETNKFKADKIVLKKRVLLKDFSLWDKSDFCLLAVKQNGLALNYIINQTK
jgi:hypothetical protein